MKLMVCKSAPYMRALEGLRYLLKEIFEDYDPLGEGIDLKFLQPSYSEEDLVLKLRRMNSGRRFLRHVQKLAHLVGAQVVKIDYNLFLLPDVQGNVILVGSLGEWRPIVVAIKWPIEKHFVPMMEAGQADFIDWSEIEVETRLGLDYEEAQRRDFSFIRQTLNSRDKSVSLVLQ